MLHVANATLFTIAKTWKQFKFSLTDNSFQKIWYINIYKGPVLFCLSHFRHVPLFVTPWTVAYQAPLSMGFSRQEYWSGLPCPPAGNLPNPGIESKSSALQVDSLLSEPPGKPKNTGVGRLSLLKGDFWPRFWTGVSGIAGGFFTSWATREDIPTIYLVLNVSTA